MTFLPRRAVSSVTPASATTVCTCCCTSSPPPATGTSSAVPSATVLTCSSLRELDIELMKRLSPRVNVIPVIGKADSLTPAELAESKKLVMEDIEHYRIPVYNFPYDIEEDDEDTVEENAELRGLMPFAIVGSEDVIEVNGRRVRARQYPWGIVEVDNPRHSDFLAVRSALLHSHLADLKEITHDFLYENYRTEKLSKSVEGGDAAYVHTRSHNFLTLTWIQQLVDEP
jgi:cell division control protein 11